MNLEKVKLWVIVSLLPPVYNHVRTFIFIPFDQANIFNHFTNLVFMVISALVIWQLKIAHNDRLDASYWALLLILIRNLLPLYGFETSFSGLETD